MIDICEYNDAQIHIISMNIFILSKKNRTKNNLNFKQSKET